jgi:hypothetical protein
LKKGNKLESFEKKLVEEKTMQKAFIKEKLFESLKTIIGEDIEILLN